MFSKLINVINLRGTILLIIVLFFLIFFPLLKGIEIKEYKSGKNLYFISFKKKESFFIGHIHSVNKGKVTEEYYINEQNEIILKNAVFESYGAGVPANLEEGIKGKLSKNGILFENINKKFKKIDMFVGKEAKHYINIKDKKIYLEYIIKNNRNISIKYNYKPLLFMFWRKQWYTTQKNLLKK